MKNLVMMIMAMALVFGLTACGGDSGGGRRPGPAVH